MFRGLTFCCSGTLSIARKDFEKLVKSKGAAFSSSVTNKTTHVVTTMDEFTNETTKVAKAKQDGIPLVSEDFVHDSIAQGTLMDPANYSFEKNSPQKKNKKRKGLTVDERVLDYYQANRKKLIQENPNITSQEIVDKITFSWTELQPEQQNCYTAPKERISQKLADLYKNLMSENNGDVEMKHCLYNCMCDSDLFCNNCVKKFQDAFDKHFEEILLNQLKQTKTTEPATELIEKPDSLEALLENEEAMVSENYQLLFGLLRFFLEFQTSVALNGLWNDKETIFSDSKSHLAGILSEYPMVKVKGETISIPLSEDDFDYIKSKSDGSSFVKDVTIEGYNFNNSLDSSVLNTIRRSLFSKCEKISAQLLAVQLVEKASRLEIKSPTKSNGTLVLFLPSFYNGGEITLKFDGTKQQLQFSMKDSIVYQWVAFTAQSKFESNPVSEGFYIALVFNLVDSSSEPDENLDPQQLQAYTRRIQNQQYNDSQNTANIPRFLECLRVMMKAGIKPTVLFSREYSMINEDTLKGRDLQLYLTLKKEFQLSFVQKAELQLDVKKETEIPKVTIILPKNGDSTRLIHPFFKPDLPIAKYIGTIGPTIKEVKLEDEEDNDDEENEDDEEENEENGRDISLVIKCSGLKVSINQKVEIPFNQLFPDFTFHFQ